MDRSAACLMVRSVFWTQSSRSSDLSRKVSSTLPDLCRCLVSPGSGERSDLPSHAILTERRTPHPRGDDALSHRGAKGHLTRGGDPSSPQRSMHRLAQGT